MSMNDIMNNLISFGQYLFGLAEDRSLINVSLNLIKSKG